MRAIFATLFALLSLLSSCRPAIAQVQLCPPEKVAALKAALPRTENPDWQRLFDDPRTLVYTDQEMPPAFQMADGGLIRGGVFVPVNASTVTTTFHWTRYNISGGYPDRFKPAGLGGNGNVEFPWREPGGMHACENYQTFKLLRLPDREGGGVLPIVYRREGFRGFRGGDVHSGLAWYLPKGTIAGEALAMRDSGGKLHVFEVRLRIDEGDYHNIEILRPFPTARDLAEALAEYDEEGMAAQIGELTLEKPLTVRQISDRMPANYGQIVQRQIRSGNYDLIGHRTPAFEAEAGWDVLPPLGEEAAKELLRRPFKSAVGAVWREGTNGVKAFAPTSEEPFSIVPEHYAGTFLGTDTDSCAKCHEHTTRHVDAFDPGRDWYGYIRGSRDHFFTVSIVASNSLSTNGGPVPVRLREEFLQGGMLEAFDAGRHSRDIYPEIKR